jgi:hypothetical protein
MWGLAIGAFCTFIAGSLWADEPDPDPTPPVTPGEHLREPRQTEPAAPVRVVREWYGWQTLVADGVVPVIGGPLVHWVHENPGRAGLGLAARVVVPVGFATGAVSTTAAITKDNDNSPVLTLESAVVAAFVSYAAVRVVDAAIFACDEKKVPGPTLAPIGSVQRGGGHLRSRRDVLSADTQSLHETFCRARAALIYCSRVCSSCSRRSSTSR